MINWTLVTIGLIAIGAAGYPNAWRRPSYWVMVPLIVGLLIMPALTVTAGFGEFDLLAAVHHLSFGMVGADYGIIIRALRPLVSVLLVYVVCVYWLSNLLQMSFKGYYFAALLIAMINPLSINAMNMVMTPRVENDLAVRVHDPGVEMNGVAPDVLLIYLEGLDREFLDRSRFGDSYDGIAELAPQGLTFTQIKQVEGTGWSLAGIVASHCGLPLLPNGLRNMYRWGDQEAFLGDHRCLSDVMSEVGYQTAYIMGGVIEFGGIDLFIKSHGYDTAIGRDQLAERYSEERLELGAAVRRYDDALTLDTAKDIYQEMAPIDDPLLLTILTYGPHGKSGTVASNCSQTGRAYETEDLTETVRCTIQNVRSFLSWWESVRRDRPALVLLVSDHLNHLWLYDSEEAQEGRSNTFFAMGYDLPHIPRGEVNDRLGSMMDVFPTILSMAGIISDGRGGLGVSLVDEGPTLLEQRGYYRINRELNRNYDLQQVIWGSD
ncbi:sulfatase-like hydrolase/transferase [Loktanella sp. S4079]|uniref:sulfatase-like hydrolase/transferase n=1 Tax=Loktanella sp. S4079 TaxID=579483 RepID=UPI00138DFAB2|nr:sulfatase-like hydrolase/transferase [Loktanella sp. S4079]